MIGYLIQQEMINQEKKKMVEAAKLIDELHLGWDEEEEGCAIIDVEVSHKWLFFQKIMKVIYSIAIFKT